MRITILILALLVVSLAKPIYDFKKSYVINLTPINFADQVSKYRQNTNYVSIVQFYKYSGTNYFIQMENHSHLYHKWTSGPINSEEFLGLELLIVINTKISVINKE
jgi:hypothetical protein